MSLATQRILRLIFDQNGVIVRERGASVLRIHARGDKRTRPIACVERVDVEDWEARRIVELGPKGYQLTEQTARRILNGVPLSEIEQQAELLPGTQTSQRRVRANRLSVIDRLERRSDGCGGTLFDAAQIAAARRFARSVHAAGGGRINASDYTAPQVDGGNRAGRAEDAVIHRLDASRAFTRAKAGMDPRVAWVVTQVLGHEVPLARVARDEGWTAGVAEMLLRMGLEHLVAHYGTRAGERRAG